MLSANILVKALGFTAVLSLVAAEDFISSPVSTDAPLGNLVPMPPIVDESPSTVSPPLGNLVPLPPITNDEPTTPPLGNLVPMPPNANDEPTTPPLGNLVPMPPIGNDTVTTGEPPLGNLVPLPTIPDDEPNYGDLCDAIYDKDIVGFDLASAKASSIFKCVPDCRNTKGCVTFTWNNYNNGTCWLKSHKGKLVDKKGVQATFCTLGPSLVCNPYKDIDFVGNDIANKPAKAFGDCCDICNEYAGCSAYSWSDHNGGTCWLKSGAGQVIEKAGVISSFTKPLSKGVCRFENDTDFVDNDIGNKPAKDAGVCCSLCQANPACKAYSWSNYVGGTCWMKSGKGTAIPAKGVISATVSAL